MDNDNRNQDVWITQLTQLNQRVRHYAAQIWQVPFAYLGLVLLALGQSWGADSLVRGCVATGMSAIGVLVVVHFFGLLDRNNAAVNAIADIERDLHLRKITTTSYLITCPLVLMLIIVVLALPFVGWIL